MLWLLLVFLMLIVLSSHSLCDSVNVIRMLYGERVITWQVVTSVESASPSIPKQREVLLCH